MNSNVPAALDNPEASGAKRLRAWTDAGPATLKGLDTRMLQAKYGPDTAGTSRMIEGSFRLPLGTTWNAYTSHRNQCVGVFVDQMGKQGFDVDRSRDIKVYPGIYPAVDLLTNVSDLGAREFVIRAWFHKRDAKTVRIELPTHLLTPVHAGN